MQSDLSVICVAYSFVDSGYIFIRGYLVGGRQSLVSLNKSIRSGDFRKPFEKQTEDSYDTAESRFMLRNPERLKKYLS